MIPASEFEDPSDVEVGDEIEVLLERLENDEGMVVLSKEKAAARQNWDKIVSVFKGEGLIKGKVKAVVKGGLTVNVGVEAFLPASQIDIVPPKICRDLSETPTISKSSRSTRTAKTWSLAAGKSSSRSARRSGTDF